MTDELSFARVEELLAMANEPPSPAHGEYGPITRVGVDVAELRSVLAELLRHRSGYGPVTLVRVWQELVPAFAPVMPPSADPATCVRLLRGRMDELRREAERDRKAAESAHLYARTIVDLRAALRAADVAAGAALGEDESGEDDAPESYP